MDKNKIKKYLSERFLSEDATPGITMANKIKKEEGKTNKDGVKAIEKDMSAYDKDLKKTDKDMSKMATNKYNYTNAAEKTYHEEMEILNGQEMVKYASEPGKEFSQKAKEGIEGSSRMGNAIGGNAEQAWGASSDNFGKELVNRIKGSEKKRAIADAPIDSLTSLGDKIAYPNDKVSVTPDRTAMSGGAGKNNKGDMTPAVKSAITKTKIKTVDENSSTIQNNKPEIKESMKRLKFKNAFDGSNTTQKIGHALTLIPEAYKADKKEFEMTDGDVTCRVRWEGTLTEGKAVILKAANKTKINEDIDRMKALFNYKSQDTLGLVKGKARIDENKAFADVWNKTKKLLSEEEDIESVTAPVKDADKVVKVAPEAKKEIQGSVSTDKGTKAPAPKKGSMESLDDAVNVAPEAKKHIEGSVAEVKKTEAPAPKEGEWDEISVPQAADAKKHIESGTATHKKTDTAKVVKEEEDPMSKLDTDTEEETPETEEDDDAPEVSTPADDFHKPDEDDSIEDKEPSAKDIKNEVPPVNDVPAPIKGGATIMKSPSNPTKLYIKDGAKIVEVPPQYMEMAASKAPNIAKIILDKMEVDASGEQGNDDEVDEGMFSKSPEETKQIGLKAISMHPVKKKTYADLVAQDPAKAEKYAMFVGKNPEAKYIGWNAGKNDFELTGNYSVASGEGTSGK